jgi:hypothetical protein
MVMKMTQNDNSYNPRIKRHLDLLRDTPPRDPEAAKLGKENYLKLAASLPVPVSEKRTWRLNEWLYAITRKKERHTMFTISTLVVVLAMLFGGAGATVYAAQDSMPNDTLYAVKTWSEDVKLGLTSNPEAKYDLLESYLYRRFAELDALLADGEDIPDNFVTRTQDQLKAMGDSVAQMDKNTDPTQIQDRDRVMLKSPCDLIEEDPDVSNENVPLWALHACEMLRAEENRSEACTDDVNGCGGELEPLQSRPQEDPTLDLGGNGPGPAGDTETEFIKPVGPRTVEICDTVTGECVLVDVGGHYQLPQAPETSPSDPVTSPSGNYQNQGDTSQPGSGSDNGNGGKP